MLPPSGRASTRCSVCRFDPEGCFGRRQERVSRAQRLGAKIDAVVTSADSRDRTSRIRTRENARKLRAIRQRPGNAGSHRTVWWAREDSNLQPDRYERMVYYAFDLLHLDGFDTRAAPLVERKRPD